jgi:hypothetical protein
MGAVADGAAAAGAVEKGCGCGGECRGDAIEKGGQWGYGEWLWMKGRSHGAVEKGVALVCVGAVGRECGRSGRGRRGAAGAVRVGRPSYGRRMKRREVPVVRAASVRVAKAAR